MDTQGDLNGDRLDRGTGNQLGDVGGERSKPPTHPPTHHSGAGLSFQAVAAVQ